MSRSLLRSVLELRTPLTRLPPSFLLPNQARLRSLSTTTPTEATIQPVAAAPTPSPASFTATEPEPTPVTAIPSQPLSPKHAPLGILYPREPQEPSSTVAAALTPATRASIAQLLPLLRAQPSHYITAHIWGRPYLVTVGDSIRLPFRMPGVLPGDVLRLDRASALGSRDYTLKGAPHVDERLFECRATVLGVESEPLRVKVKTKRRQRKNKTVKSKHRYTILRVSELVVKGPEAIGL